MKKSLAELIDALITVNIKIFMEMEKENGDLKVVKTLNKQRSDLKNAIGGEEVKTYE